MILYFLFLINIDFSIDSQISKPADNLLMLIISLGKIPDSKNMTILENFLVKYEKYCVSLFDRIKRHEVSVYCIVGEKHELKGVFTYSSGGQILHCIPEALLLYDELLAIFRIYFSNFDLKNIFSVIGEEVGTNLILSAIYLATKKMPMTNQSFHLMQYFPQKESRGNGLKFQPQNINSVYAGHCSMQLLETLLPIQEAYEREEVLNEDQDFNPLLSKFVLKKNLSEQNVYAAFYENKLVSKATINADGKNFVQIGGVFTVPAFRKLGFAEFLIKKLVFEKNRLGKQLVLFVKPKNTAALTLYKRCGFSSFGKMKISYY